MKSKRLRRVDSSPSRSLYRASGCEGTPQRESSLVSVLVRSHCVSRATAPFPQQLRVLTFVKTILQIMLVSVAMPSIGNAEVVVRPAVLADHGAIGDLYVASRKDALPTVRQVWGDDSIRKWLGSLFHTEGQMFVAETEKQVVGFMRIVGDDLDQLYLMPGYYRRGIGTKLLDRAKEISPEKLRLFTFQVNQRARNFYERHGFCVVDMNDGERNEEKEPDILYEWKP